MKKTALLIILSVTLLAGCSATSEAPSAQTAASESTTEEETAQEAERDASDAESTTEEVEEENAATKEDAYRMYAKKVQELEDAYGVLSLDNYPYAIPDTVWYTANGVSYLSLTDFDDDGVEELVAATGRYGARQLVRVYTAKESGLKEIYCNHVGGGGSPVIFQVEISRKDGKNYLLRQTASPTFDVYEMRDGIMKSLGEVDGGGLTFYNDPGEVAEQMEESRKENNSFIFNFPEEFCPSAPDALLTAVNEVKDALSLEKQHGYNIGQSTSEDYAFSDFLWRGCTIREDGFDETTQMPIRIYHPVFKGENTKKEYSFADLDGDGIKEMLLREDGEDLYVIQTTDNWGNLEVIEDAAIVSAAKDSQESFMEVPDKEVFTSAYTVEADDYIYDSMTIEDVIAINGDDYKVELYDDRVIVAYSDIAFFPATYDVTDKTFDMKSKTDRVMITGDKRIFGAVYGHATFPELKEMLENSYYTVEEEPEKTHNAAENRDEYVLEVDTWRTRQRFIWLDDPETTPCFMVEATVKEAE